MMASISAAPTIKAQNLTAPTRTGGEFEASWKVPSDATKDSNGKRWTATVVLWTITYNYKVNGEYKTEKRLHRLTTDATSDTTTLTIANLWPASGDWRDQVRSVSVRVRGWNSKGYGPAVNNTLTMQVPAKPTLTLSFNAETGKVTALLRATNVTGAKHRYDNVLWVKRQGVGGTSLLLDGEANVGVSRTKTFDIDNASNLAAGQCIRITGTARNRGMRGNGDLITKTLFIAHPNAPVCGAPSLSYVTRGVLSTASVLVPITNPGFVSLADGTKVYPTTVKLQRLRNSESTNATDASNEGGWSDVDGATDSGVCAGLMDTWADGVSDDGLRTWYRVAAMRNGYTQYGVPVFAKCLYSAASAASVGKASIVKLASDSGGTSATLTWHHWGFSDGGGVELSWSDDYDAWTSTTEPSVYSITSNATSGTRSITGLTAGTRYYVRVRGWNYELDGTTVKYGNYSKRYSVLAETSTGTVTITSIDALANNAGVKVVLTKQETNDAAELSWSSQFYAWTSNETPSVLVSTTGNTTKTLFVYGLEVGTRYYFRARSVDGDTYGAYSGRTSFALDEADAAVGAASITSATSGADGETVIVAMRRTTTSDALQLSWSDDEHAWESNEQPDAIDVTWAEGKTATAYVHGLDEGTPYYFRARCVSEGGTSDWSAVVTSTPYDVPHDVTVTAPAIVALGDPLPVSWAFDSASVQTGWQVVLNGKVVRSGKDLRTSAPVPAERITSLGAGTYALYVRVRTGGGWASSVAGEVSVAEAPTGTLTVSPTLTAQPASVTLTGSTSSLSAGVTITAYGCAEDDLHDAQPSGLVIWSGTFDGLAWTASNDAYTTTLTLPEGLDLRDGASYAVSASITDTGSDLTTELEQASFAVAWSHQAAAPNAAITVDADELTADIAITAPTGAAATDVCDVWRMTPDGSYLIAEGREFGTTVTDMFAPFAEQRSDWQTFYRIVTRTVDGDLSFNDVTYDLRCDHMRIDWGIARSVDLVYALSVSDGWAKDFAAITHLDGSVGGTWSSGVKRTAKLGGVLVRTASSEQQAALRELAQHRGPAFVRTNNGSAYMADVQVSALAWSHKTYQLTATLSAQELSLTPDYMAQPVEEE